MADNNPLKVSFVDPIQLNVNLPNVKGEPGKDGDSAYLTAVKNGFVGTEREWLESLKAKVDVTPAYETLMRNNVYCKTKDIADVLNGFIVGLGDLAKKQAKPLEYDTPLAGQMYISISGEPHYKVALRGASDNERVEIESADKFRFNLKQPFGGDNITLEYFNMLGEKVSDVTIKGNTGVKTEIASYEFANDYITTTYEFPEVISVGAYAFHSNTNSVKLPKATRIDKYAFDNSGDIETIEIPSFVFTNNNQFYWTDLYALRTLVINDSAELDVVYNIASRLAVGTVYNQDKTKKFDKATKTWVSAQ